MITASRFSSSHASFWQSCFPAMESYVRVVNSGAYERFFDEMSWPLEPQRSSLVSEVAICIAKRSGKEDIDQAYAEARRRLSGLPGVEDDGIELNDPERTAARELAFRTNTMIDSLKGKKDAKIFDPPFAGFGNLMPSHGDVLAGSVLFELKAVDRGFRATDFRQLTTYVLQNSFERNNAIERIVLINARRGIYYDSYLSDFIFDTSAATIQDIQLRFAAALGFAGLSR